MKFDKDKAERSQKEWDKRIEKSMASGGLIPGPELPPKKEIGGGLTPGDHCLISDLEAGDVFEWDEKLYIWGKEDRCFPVVYRGWNFTDNRFSGLCFYPKEENDDSVTYLGKLTAEMVRELLTGGENE